jgi:hypothetical protein
MSVTFYEMGTGKIIGNMSGPPDCVALSVESEDSPYVLGYFDIDEHYIDLSGEAPEPRLRPAMPVSQDKTAIMADGEDAVALSGLPAPCKATIGSAEYDVEDGKLEWSTLMPATYPIRAEAFPYLDWKGEVAAVAGDVQAV